MTPFPWTDLLVIAGLIVTNGVFALSELAIVSAKRAQLQAHAARGSKGAQTALELTLAELQAPDLDVEEMAGLYRRASRYADRCEQLLQQVEQQVLQWDPGQPLEPPVPYQP